MLSILFVDDEDHLLQGIRRLLHSHRQEWTMTFVSSGEEAVRRMAQEHFDIVVTDMRMPEVDGSRVLFESYVNCPSTMRCVLSGQAERTQTCKVSGTAQTVLIQADSADGVGRDGGARRKLEPVATERRSAVGRDAPGCGPVPAAYFGSPYRRADETRSADGFDRQADFARRRYECQGCPVGLVVILRIATQVALSDRGSELLGVDMLRELAIEHGLFTPFVDKTGSEFLDLRTVRTLCASGSYGSSHPPCVSPMTRSGQASVLLRPDA